MDFGNQKLDKYTVILVPSGSATAATTAYKNFVDEDAVNPFDIKLWPSTTTDFNSPPSHYLMARRITLYERLRIEGLVARINNNNIKIRDINIRKDPNIFFDLLKRANLVRYQTPPL